MQRKIFSLLWHNAWKYKWLVSTSLVLAAVTPIINNFIGPLFIAELLGRIQHGTVSIDTSWPLLIGYAITQLWGEVIGWRIVMYCVWKFETKADRDLYHTVFNSLTHQTLRFHANRFGGALVSQTSKLISASDRFWDTLIWHFVPSVSAIVAAIVIISFIFWQYALILLIITIIFITMVFFGTRFLSRRSTLEAQAHTRITARIADVVTNVMAVKSHGNEKKELTTLEGVTGSWQEKSLSTMRGFNLASTGYSFMIAIMNVSALIAAIVAVDQKAISIAAVYLCITYTFTVARQLWEMNSIMRDYYRITGDAYDMVEILSLQPEIKNNTGSSLNISKGLVEFNNVDFAHEKNEQKLFNNFTIRIQPGEKIGLVGHSGAGKSTVTNLLLRFMDVNGGTITIDHQDISHFSQESLRRQVAYVPQEPLLFHRSLAENISYGKHDATNEEIQHAAKLAHAAEFIEKLPKGFETLVGERGIKLSGGQKQRIAIARAILKDAPILLLDEATSALDSQSERLIQDALKKLMQGRTSIVIAHRLSTISHLDRIIVLDNGNVVEQGTHTELLRRGGIYAKLWAHQSGGFLED